MLPRLFHIHHLPINIKPAPILLHESAGFMQALRATIDAAAEEVWGRTRYPEEYLK